MSLTYKEAMKDGFPNIGMSMGGGKSTRLYRVTVEDNDDIIEFFNTFLGGTSLDVGDGRMQRTPPLADPQFAWMMCSNIPKLTPVLGIPEEEEAEPQLEVPPVSQYGFYTNWDAVVEFSPRKFPIVLDYDVAMINGSWTPDVNTDSTGSAQTFKYANEMIRYTTDPSFTSAYEYVTAQQGNMKFKTNGTSYGGFNPNDKTFPAKLKMLQPDMVMKVTTVMMPYRYFTSSRSYITGGTARAPWIGRVNQNTVNIAGYTFPRGSLQYMSYEVEMFSPPSPDRDLFFPGVFSSEKLMNLTLTFRYTLRKVTDNTTAPTNANYVNVGFNALPWTLSRKFHYAETASGMPSWPSAPFELLWTDPDYLQTVG